MFVTGFIAENITNAQESRPAMLTKVWTQKDKCTHFRPITTIRKSQSLSTSSQQVVSIFVGRMPQVSICSVGLLRYLVLDIYLVVYLKKVTTKDLSKEWHKQ